MSEPSKNSDEALLEKHAAELSEHFDSVMIFVTRVEANLTRSLHHGEGNWCTHYGQIIDWIKAEDERRRQEIRSEEET